MRAFPSFFCIALLIFPGVVYSQDPQAPEAKTAAPIETDSERIARIEKVVALDKARLAKLKEERKDRVSRFEKANKDVTTRETRLEEMQAKLEGLSDPVEVDALQKEIDAYKEKLDLVKGVADLSLQAERAVVGQIQALERKIEIDQRALDELLGPVDVPQISETPVSVTAPGQPGLQAQSQSASVPGMVPGIPGQPAVPAATPDVPKKKMLPETAEQIEARKQAARSKIEADQAEQAVLSFLERKEALQHQIDLEKALLATGVQSKEIADKALLIRQRELDAAKSGGNKAEIEEARAKLDRVIVALQRIDAEIDQHKNTLEGFSKRMQALHDEQQAVTEQAEQKRLRAEKELKQSVWLDSPFHPKNIMRWGLDRGPNMLIVFVAVFILLVLIRGSVRKIARVTVGKGRRSRSSATTRADTLALSFGSAATMIIAIAGIFLVLEAAGVDIATVLGGVAVLGVAIAFGAQNLMRDYFNGFIILIEDQYELNDLVTIGNVTGRVERVSLRTTALRDLQGKLHFIPNGEIKSVTNRSYEWAQIVLDIRVSYKESVDRVMEEILSVAREVCSEPEYKDSIIDGPTMLGVDEFTEFGVIIKCLLRTKPSELFRIKREILRRIKNRFDELGIEIPMPGAAALARS
jgi:small-conductance mechanosensitive channel